MRLPYKHLPLLFLVLQDKLLVYTQDNRKYMTRTLIWNFEFSTQETPLLIPLDAQKEDDLKWESRLFWPDNQIIKLKNLHNALLDLTYYKNKQKQDEYYLLPDGNFNIKRRRNQLIYKPIVDKSAFAIGFGSKINLEDPTQTNTIPLQELLKRAQTQAKIIPVKKEAFVFKFSTVPTIKLELAKLEVHNKIYFSACVEGRSRNLVETISKGLLGLHKSCDYVTFLTTIPI